MPRGGKAAFDAGMLILMLQENAAAPLDPKSGSPINKARERVEHLKTTLAEDGYRIIIPTPALSEFLVGAGDAMDRILDELHSESCFEVAPFSERAAIEAAIATHGALKLGDKRSGIDSDWQKVKVDRQIVAVAKILEVEAIYTHSCPN